MNNIKTWEELSSKIKSIVFNESFDLIVAIANGGIIIPAAFINQRWHYDLFIENKLQGCKATAVIQLSKIG